MVKVQYMLSDEAVEIINANATERKRGEWISNVIIEHDRLFSGQIAEQECGVFETISDRLNAIEKRLIVVLDRLADQKGKG